MRASHKHLKCRIHPKYKAAALSAGASTMRLTHVANELWVGIFKVIQETAELNQVLAKLCQVPEGRHWDEYTRSDGSAGEKPLRERLVEEMADVYAALDYMKFSHLSYHEEMEVRDRRRAKLDLYRQWQRDGQLRGVRG